MPTGAQGKTVSSNAGAIRISALANLGEQTRLIWQVARSQPVTIDLFGGEQARRAFLAFTAPHRRFRVVRSKTFGAALLPLPNAGDDGFRGPSFRNLRQRRQRALNLGYSFREFAAAERVDEILAINRSADMRQGKPLPPFLTDAASVHRHCASRGPFFGTFDAGGILRAYCHVPVLGDVFNFTRILGDHDRLKDGIMYLMVWETVTAMSAELGARGHPSWAMYDMFIGGRPGLRIFKKECGFRPYHVVWRWRDGA